MNSYVSLKMRASLLPVIFSLSLAWGCSAGQASEPVVVRVRIQKSLLQSKSVLSPKPRSPARIAEAMARHHYIEKPIGSNRDGREITAESRRIAKRDGLPWCAFDASAAAKEAGYSQFRTGRAFDFTKAEAAKVWTSTDVARGVVVLQPGWFAVKGRPGGNHVDAILEIYKDSNGLYWMKVRGGNVNDRNSTRTVKVLQPGNRFWYSHFVEPL